MSKPNTGWKVVASKTRPGAKGGGEWGGKKKPSSKAAAAEPPSRMVQVVPPFREWKVAPVSTGSSSFSGLPRAVTGYILSFLAGCSPGFLLRCSTVCKLWRQLLLVQLTSPPRWDGFDLCAEACDALNHGESLVAQGMLVAFAFRRELPARPPQDKVARHTAAMHAKVAQWLAARGPREQYAALAAPHAESRPMESVRNAFTHFDAVLRPRILVGEELADTLPLFGSCVPHAVLLNVPRGGDLSLALMAQIMANDAAYGEQRDADWPPEACREWLRERLRELDAGDDYEVYFPGDYWCVTQDADGISDTGGSSSSLFESSLCMAHACVCVTRHAVLVICSADDD